MGWRTLVITWLGWFAFGTTTPAYADIFECKGPQGTLHYTNLKHSKKKCRLAVRTSRKFKAAQRAKTKAAEASKRAQRYQALIAEAASLYELPEPFIRAVMRVESNFNSLAVSHAGAMGLMQLMPQTASSLGVVDPFEPRQNVLGGARYLRILTDRFNGDLTLTIAAYNAGHNAVEQHNGIPPYQETQRYVQRVLKYYRAYSNQDRP